MKILYIVCKYDYGKKERGYSFEHYNFYDSLIKMENGRHEIVYFPFDEIMTEMGQEEMNKKLLETVAVQKPDLCFFFLFTDEIYPTTIKKITDSGVTTYNWFADDHWRFPIFSKYYAPNFSWISTTDSRAVEKYHKLGYQNVIKTQWACNHNIYSPLPPPLTPPRAGGELVGYDYDVSFVGQPHGNRRQIMGQVAASGAKIDCFGGGWPNGRVSQEKMIEIFGHSKINLNPTKSSGNFSLKYLAKIFLEKRANKLRLLPPWSWPSHFSSFLGRWREQIKGRNFEIPGCAGFLLTGAADNLEEYYLNGKEIVIYNDLNDLIEKIKYYLEHETERQAIALAGYRRTLFEHTYEARFKEIFKMMGF